MAKLDQLFTIAGTSRHPELGMKVRMSNTSMYVKALLKVDHEAIVLIELPSAMTKVDAVKFIKDLPEFQSAEQQEAIDYFLDLKAPTAAKEPKVPKVKKEIVASVVLTAEEKDDENKMLDEALVIDPAMENEPF